MYNNLISIIIVNWNGKKWLKNCFDSIINQNYKNFEVVFVDNNSSDDSIEYLEKNYCKKLTLKIIKNNDNLGFCVANNIGVENCSGDVLFFLNNDIEFYDKDLFFELLDYKNKNNLNIVGPIVIQSKNDILNWKLGYGGVDFLGYAGGLKYKLFFIPGCALMISKSDFKYLNGYDDKYFMYSEDLDLGWRAFLFGMKINVCEKCFIIHFGGGSSERTVFNKNAQHTTTFIRRYEVEKNTLRNILKNYSLIFCIIFIPIYFFQNLAEFLLYIMTFNFSMSKNIINAFFWNIVNINNTLLYRKEIQKKRIVDDFYILSKMVFSFNKIRSFLIIRLPKFK